MPPLRRALLLALVAVLAAGCQVRLAADIAIGRDGSGTFEFAVAVDEELARDLEEAGVDPLAGLEEVEAPGWEVIEESPDDGGVGVRLRAGFDGPQDLRRVADELHRELDQDDPRVHDGLRLEQRDDGSLALSGRVGLQLPSVPGAEGVGVTFDTDDLERLLEERGDEFVRYDVRVTLPGEPVEHDADEVDGNSLVWRAPLDGMRDISAVSAPPGPPRWLLLGGVAVAAALIAGTAAMLWRRREA